MDIKITEEESTIKVSFYRWNCPVTGEKMERRTKPRSETDFLSQAGKEVRRKEREEAEVLRKKKNLEDFKEEYSNFIGAKIVDLLPNYDGGEIGIIVIEGKNGKHFEIEYDYDDGDDPTFDFCEVD